MCIIYGNSYIICESLQVSVAGLCVCISGMELGKNIEKICIKKKK